MDEKKQNQPEKPEKPEKLTDERINENKEKIFDMKQELEDYMEEQGIYLRQ